MKLHLADMPWTVALIYPLVAAGGMLHANCVISVAQLAVNFPDPPYSVLILCAILYTGFLTYFFRTMNGDKIAFQIAFLVVVSAVLGLVFFPLCQVIGQGVTGMRLTEGMGHSVLCLIVLLLDLAGAFLFVWSVDGHDLHDVSPTWVWMSQLMIIVGGLGYALWEVGAWQAAYHAIANLFGGKPAVAPAASPSP